MLLRAASLWFCVISWSRKQRFQPPSRPGQRQDAQSWRGAEPGGSSTTCRQWDEKQERCRSCSKDQTVQQPALAEQRSPLHNPCCSQRVPEMVKTAILLFLHAWWILHVHLDSHLATQGFCFWDSTKLLGKIGLIYSALLCHQNASQSRSKLPRCPSESVPCRKSETWPDIMALCGVCIWRRSASWDHLAARQTRVRKTPIATVWHTREQAEKKATEVPTKLKAKP